MFHLEGPVHLYICLLLSVAKKLWYTCICVSMYCLCVQVYMYMCVCVVWRLEDYSGCHSSETIYLLYSLSLPLPPSSLSLESFIGLVLAK